MCGYVFVELCECLIVGFECPSFRCNFHTPPPRFGSREQLELLDLSRNHLSSVSPAVANLVHLKELLLAQNRLATIPLEVGRLGSLRFLSVARNRLDSLPSELSACTALRIIDVKDNPLGDCPHGFAKWSCADILAFLADPKAQKKVQRRRAAHRARRQAERSAGRGVGGGGVDAGGRIAAHDGGGGGGYGAGNDGAASRARFDPSQDTGPGYDRGYTAHRDGASKGSDADSGSGAGDGRSSTSSASSGDGMTSSSDLSGGGEYHPAVFTPRSGTGAYERGSSQSPPSISPRFSMSDGGGFGEATSDFTSAGGGADRMGGERGGLRMHRTPSGADVLIDDRSLKFNRLDRPESLVLLPSPHDGLSSQQETPRAVADGRTESNGSLTSSSSASAASSSSSSPRESPPVPLGAATQGSTARTGSPRLAPISPGALPPPPPTPAAGAGEYGGRPETPPSHHDLPPPPPEVTLPPLSLLADDESGGADSPVLPGLSIDLDFQVRFSYNSISNHRLGLHAWNFFEESFDRKTYFLKRFVGRSPSLRSIEKRLLGLIVPRVHQVF